MTKLKGTVASYSAKEVAAALSDIFPQMLIHMSRLGGSRSLAMSIHLTTPQMRALIAVDINGKGMRMSALADMLGITQSTATDVTKRLMRMGYMLKEPLKEDKRVVCVSLSPAGKKLVKEMRGEKFQQFLSITETLPESECQRLLKSHEWILSIYSRM